MIGQIPDFRQHPTTLETASALAPLERFFHPASVWRQPVSDYRPYQHPTYAQANSRNWVISLCEQMDLDPNTGKLKAGGQKSKMSMGGNIPCYVVPGGYDRRPIGLDSLGLKTVGGPELHAQLQKGVPAPLDMTYGVSGVNDAWVNIYQPSTDTLWEGYRATRSSPDGPIDTFRWGGVIVGVSKHFGTYQDRMNVDGTMIERTTWSGNATSVSNLAGLVGLEEVEQATANSTGLGHAIPISLGHAQRTPVPYVYPATRGDGDMYDAAGFIPEGARIVFPPGSDSSRVRPEFMWAYATGVTHGLIPVDKTGYGVSLHFRDYTIANQPKAWVDLLPLYSTVGDASFQYISSLPWHEAIIVNPGSP